MRTLHHILFNFTVMILMLFLITACDTYKAKFPQDDYVGNWIGLGQNQLSNEFLDQREIPVFITISETGVLTGNIGDADIQKTTLKAPTWWMKLFTKNKYKASLRLVGNIVNRESFHRDGGTLTIEGFKEGDLICHFNSTGSQVNVKNMALSVTDIKLHHPN
jgi:hypothetical protein